jgi:simple sugar transport system permease protein
MIQLLVPILAASISAATPLLFAGLGELVAERSGVINLGVEGMMLIGAVAGFACAVDTSFGVPGALVAGALAGMGAALLFAIPALSLAANQAA